MAAQAGQVDPVTRPFITVKQIRAQDLEGDDTWRALGRGGWETPFGWTTDTWGTPAGLLPDDLVEIQVEEPDPGALALNADNELARGWPDRLVTGVDITAPPVEPILWCRCGHKNIDHRFYGRDQWRGRCGHDGCDCMIFKLSALPKPDTESSLRLADRTACGRCYHPQSLHSAFDGRCTVEVGISDDGPEGGSIVGPCSCDRFQRKPAARP